MTTRATTTRYRVEAFHTPSPDRLVHLDDHVITVADGAIVSVQARRDDPEPVDVDLVGDHVVLPGFVDTHVHAPQWPQLGTGLDLPLEEWLGKHTFPLEARYVDLGFARTVWQDLVATLLAHGTTTAAYFATRHPEATVELGRVCAELGQRGLVGRVAMDHPEMTPPDLRDAGADEAVQLSAEVNLELDALGSLVTPVITPRFVPACTDALLSGLGELAAATGVRIQTHCSESDWEHEHVATRFGRSDTECLEVFGLLRQHTILAHGDHMADGDLRRAALAGAGVAHCPRSNMLFANAVFGVRRARELDLRVGLGTDIAGGDQPGVASQMSLAVAVSQMLEDGVDRSVSPGRRGRPGSRIGVVEAFFLATAGGADLVGLPVGVFEPGRRFDALAVRVEAGGTGRASSGLRFWDGVDDEPARRFDKVVRLAGPADLAHVWVDGVRRAGTAGSAAA